MTDDAVEDFLAHYGVPGMKWGKKGSRNANYSDTQVKRDKQVYGARGTRRINKNLNKGEAISTARSIEKTRRDRVMGRNKYVRQGGKVAGAVGGIAVANVALSGIGKLASTQFGRKLSQEWTGNTAAADLLRISVNNPAVRVIASTGAAKVATMFAGDAAVAANMRANGYDPNRR